jgi:hypothetical protein
MTLVFVCRTELDLDSKRTGYQPIVPGHQSGAPVRRKEWVCIERRDNITVLQGQGNSRAIPPTHIPPKPKFRPRNFKGTE